MAGSVNPAILFSRLIYHKDIRDLGSGNPGFTNFKRVFGNKWAWWVLLADLGKAAAAVALFSPLFRRFMGDYSLGAAYTGLFCMVGHAFPVWYGFKGGKGVLVYMSTIWFVDWKAGSIAVAVLVILLLTTRYMSLSTMLSSVAGVVYLAVSRERAVVVTLLVAAESLFMIIRHHANIVKLIHGREARFSFSKNDK